MWTSFPLTSIASDQCGRGGTKWRNLRQELRTEPGLFAIEGTEQGWVFAKRGVLYESQCCMLLILRFSTFKQQSQKASQNGSTRRHPLSSEQTLANANQHVIFSQASV